jgi:hypothetical protein
VLQRDVWPGVDVAWHGTPGRLEYDLHVAAGADPSAIRLGFAGASGVRLERSGNLSLLLPGGGTVTQPAPVAFQRRGDGRVRVPARYVRDAHGAVSVLLGRHDPRRPVLIDPGLVYSTFLGGGGGENGFGITTDASGAAYVTGITSSANFPATPGAFQSSQRNIFVTKLNPAGTALVYSTYLGGSQSDFSAGIAVDAAGAAYVTGATTSPDFPTTPGAVQPSLHNDTVVGISNAFVTKLSPAGDGLEYSTFLGGSTNFDAGAAIAVDGAGHAFVTGTAGSSNFPTTPGAFQTTRPGNGAGFVAELNAAGSGVLYSTFLGGSASPSGNTDVPRGIAVDPAGEAYVTGSARTTDFPTTPGAFQTTAPGFGAAFVTKLNAAGSDLVYSTYLGGSLLEEAHAIAIDGTGHAYVTGFTASSDFPTTPGAFQASLGGPGEGQSVNSFVTKLDTDGGGLAYSTYLGGSTADDGNFVDDRAAGIAVDAAGHAFVAGSAHSNDFPTTADAEQSQFGGFADAFVTELAADGGSLVHSTYLGGDGNDQANAIAVDGPGDAYATGASVSADFPVTPGAFQTSLNGPSDAFVAKLGLGRASTQIAYTGPTSAEFGTPVTLTARLTSDGSGVAGKPVTIAFGAEGCTATTDAAGSAGCSVTPTDSPAGSPYPVTASFAGDGAYQGATDTSASFTVTKAQTKTALASSANPSSAGQPVTYTATVGRATPGSGSPTGTVSFTDGGTPISGCGAVALGGGTATCTASYPSTSGSPHQIKASYNGDDDFAASSDTLSQAVGRASTTLVAARASRSLLGVTFSATLTRSADGAPLAGRPITFAIQGTTVCTAATDSHGVASCTRVGLVITIGRATYTASFAGDSAYLPSTATATL